MTYQALDTWSSSQSKGMPSAGRLVVIGLRASGNGLAAGVCRSPERQEYW